MKKVFLFLSLLIVIHTNAQELQGLPAIEDMTKTFNTIADMKTRVAKPGALYNVKGFYAPNDGGGGDFYYDPISTEATVSGIIIQVGSNPIGRWKRVIKNKTISFFETGAKGDGIQDDRPFMQAAVDFMHSKSGGNVIVPNAPVYFRDTLPLYWRSFVNLIGEGSNSIIFNDRDTSTSTRAYPYVPVYFGEMLPISYDSTNLRFYSTGLAEADKVTVSSAIIDSFKIGDLVEVRGLTGFIGADGSTKPHVFRIEKVVKKILPNTLVVEHPLDTTLTTGKIAVLGKFLPTALKAVDEYGHPFYAIESFTVSGVTFKSNGEAFLRYSAYKANFENITVNAASIINCNAMSWNTWNNITGTFWTQVAEFAMGSNNSTITGLTASWKRDTFLISTVQPLIRFGENVYNIKLRDVFVNAGSSARQGVAFDDGSYNSIERITFHGTRIAQKMIEFTTSFSGAICSNNYVKGGIFYGGNTNTYLQFNDYHGDSTTNANNFVEDVRFYGKINSTLAYRADGKNNRINNVYFQQGKGISGTYTQNFRISNSRVDGVTERLYNVTQEGNYFGGDHTKKIWTDAKNIGIGNNLIYRSNPTNNNAIRNIALGDFALDIINSGKNNVAGGYGALQNAADNEGNTALGDNAGNSLRGGNNNVFIGRNAGLSAGTNQQNGNYGCYGFNTSPVAYNAINGFNIHNTIWARSTSTGHDSVATTNAWVGINNNNPTRALDVIGAGAFTGNLKIGAYTLPAIDGTSGYVLKTNGAGAVSWQPDNNSGTGTGTSYTFNATNFSVSGSNVNTIQNIAPTSAPTFAGLTLSGYTFPNADGANGYTLKTNGAGLLSWQPDNNSGTGTGTSYTFNATNFSVSGSNVNTIQNIATNSIPTFAGLTIGSYSMPQWDGTNKQVLQTNGNGLLTWADADGAGFVNLTGINEYVWNYSTNKRAKMIISSNSTLVINNDADGKEGVLIVSQAGAGGFKLTVPAGDLLLDGIAVVGNPSQIDLPATGKAQLHYVKVDGVRLWSMGYYH